jgi:putative component of membrane protein insertase Oxa1/YidC/SpoIIIJ protein YidD
MKHVIMRRVLLVLIRLYQAYLSPYKGFRCAYGTRTGRRSCSSFGYTAIERHGVIVGSLLLRRRFRKCAQAAEMTVRRTRLPMHQAGHCDLPIGDCNFEHGCDKSDLLDCVPGDDCGCTERAWRRLRGKHESSHV